MNTRLAKKVLRPAGDERLGSYLSVGELLGIPECGLQHALKLQFLPQWTEDGDVEAVPSERSLLVDLRAADLASRPDTVTKIAGLADDLRQAALAQPDTILSIARAFSRSGSKADRDEALARAERLGLWRRDDPEPAALWGAVLLVGAALLVSACCDETDVDYPSGETDQGSTGDGGSSEG